MLRFIQIDPSPITPRSIVESGSVDEPMLPRWQELPMPFVDSLHMDQSKLHCFTLRGIFQRDPTICTGDRHVRPPTCQHTMKNVCRKIGNAGALVRHVLPRL